jgi:hypothetical protein
LEAGKYFLPAFARVNVGAVRQVQGIAGCHGAKKETFRSTQTEGHL